MHAAAPAQTLAERLADLIQRDHSGSVNAAATAMGLPQPTLAKLVAGGVASPRAGTIQRIAAHFGTSMEWLMTGRDPALSERRPGLGETQLDIYRWLQLVDSLRLPNEIDEALSVAPSSDTYFWAMTAPDITRDFEVADALGRAGRLVYQGWTEVLQILIRVCGTDKVRDALVEVADDVRLGFSVFAMHLYREGLIAGDLAEHHQRYLTTVGPSYHKVQQTRRTDKKPTRRRKRRP